MEKLAEKLNLKDLQRVCIINPVAGLLDGIKAIRPSLTIDNRIDPRFLYNFFLIFVTSPSAVEEMANLAVHNLYEDGILWFAYPRHESGGAGTIDRTKGWDMLKTLGYKPVRYIIINDEWNGIRFRNARFVKSRSSEKEG